jgi:hypothetical protein
MQQNFTTGPYSGSLVTSSYSSGSTLFGPIVNFKQLFISGTFDFFQPLGGGTPYYQRYYYNSIICPPGGCYAPILITATPLYCNTNNWTSSYSVTYNSSSALATKTIIEYSYTQDFMKKVTHSIDNSSPTMTPFSTITDFGILNNQNTIMYFRAYNSCSIGTTSSYSNVLTASCATAPSPTIFKVTIKNNSGVDWKYSIDSNSPVYSVPNNRTSSIDFTSQTKDIFLSSINQHYTGPHGGYYEGGNSYYLNVSSSNEVNGNVYTSLHSLIDSYNYSDYTVVGDYIDGGYTFTFVDDSNNASQDLQVHIDRNLYTNSGTITLNISPI